MARGIAATPPMALRSSLPSALNSQMNTGPSINTTVRTGMNLAKTSGTSVNQTEFTNTTKHDIPEEHVLLTECDTHDVAHMQTCIGKDTVPYGALLDKFHNDILGSDYADLQFPCGDAGTSGAPYQLDLRYSQYLRDIGDARNDLESFLRINQVCLFVQGINAESIQPHMADFVASNTCLKTTRRVNVIFCDKKWNDGQYDVSTWEEKTESTTNTKYLQPEMSCKNNDHKFYRFAVLQDNAKHLNSAASVQAFITGLLHAENIRPHVSRSNESQQVMRPATLAYAGMSLTYGHMSAKNGDTALTTNLFSARTNRNGPFRAHGGDDVFWLYNCELVMFDKNTHRRVERFVLTPYVLTDIMQNFVNGGGAAGMPQIPTYNMTQVGDRLRPDPVGDGPGSGNKAYPPFVFAVAPHAHSLLPWNMRGASLRDMERKMGKIVSGGSPGAQVDWVNGAGSEL